MSWLVTFKQTVPVEYDDACVEEEAIKYVCDKYNIDESDIEEVFDDK